MFKCLGEAAPPVQGQAPNVKFELWHRDFAWRDEEAPAAIVHASVDQNLDFEVPIVLPANTDWGCRLTLAGELKGLQKLKYVVPREQRPSGFLVLTTLRFLDEEVAEGDPPRVAVT